MIAQLLFFFLAIVAVAAALGLVISRNPVTSALWLILNLFCIAGLYLTLNAHFIAVIQVLVYAGAIMVLFLFVIMLLNLTALPRIWNIDWKMVVSFILGVVVLVQLVYIVSLGMNVLPTGISPVETAASGSAEVIARQLFTQFALPFEIIGILLLVATIGAVVLAKKRFT